MTDQNLVQQLSEARAMLGRRTARFLPRRWRGSGLSSTGRIVTSPSRFVSRLSRWRTGLTIRTPGSSRSGAAGIPFAIRTAWNSGWLTLVTSFRSRSALENGTLRLRPAIAASLICLKRAISTGADIEHREYLTTEAELRDRFKRGLVLQGMRALMDGRLGEAETLAQQAFAAGQQSGHPLALNSFLVQKGMTSWERGRLGDLESTLRGYVAQNPLIVFARCGLQLTLLQMGRPEEARVEFDRLAEDEFRLVPRDWNWIPSMFVLADVCADLGDAANAEILYRQLLPYASRNAMLGNAYTYGSVAFALGRLAAVWGASTTPRRISKPPSPPIGESGPRSGWVTRAANSRACC